MSQDCWPLSAGKGASTECRILISSDSRTLQKSLNSFPLIRASLPLQLLDISILKLKVAYCFRAGVFRIWLEPEPSLWPSSGSGSTLNIYLIIHENWMEINIIWCLFLSKHKIWPTCTGTCVRTYFRHFVVSFQKFQNHVLFYQEPAPDKKFLEPEPPQNRPAPKPWLRPTDPTHGKRKCMGHFKLEWSLIPVVLRVDYDVMEETKIRRPANWGEKEEFWYV